MSASADKRARIIAEQAQREVAAKEAAGKSRGEDRSGRKPNWAASAPMRSPFRSRKPRQP